MNELSQMNSNHSLRIVLAPSGQYFHSLLPGTWYIVPGMDSTFPCLASFYFLWHFLLSDWLCARGLLTAVYDLVLTKMYKLLPRWGVSDCVYPQNSHSKQSIIAGYIVLTNAMNYGFMAISPSNPDQLIPCVPSESSSYITHCPL